MKRNQQLRKKCLERDNFICQKCKLEDKKMLEVHHIIPLVLGGNDELNNLITLCEDCHHYAPNASEEFERYIKEECNGTITIFFKAWEKVRKEKPELFTNNS